MTDFRDPNYRDPNSPGYRDPNLPMDAQPWSNATWGWIAGIAVAVLVLIFIFGSGQDATRTTDAANPPATTGQRVRPATPDGAMPSQTPMNRPAPAPSSGQ